jgi:hypothetical protein
MEVSLPIVATFEPILHTGDCYCYNSSGVDNNNRCKDCKGTNPKILIKKEKKKNVNN